MSRQEKFLSDARFYFNNSSSRRDISNSLDARLAQISASLLVIAYPLCVIKGTVLPFLLTTLLGVDLLFPLFVKIPLRPSPVL